MTRRQKQWERNHRRGQHAAFIGRYPKKCWYCADETQDTECAFAEDDVLLHTGCLILMNPDARIYDKRGNRVSR
jgi:hypothetical protein